MASTVLVFAERRDGEIKRPALEALGREDYAAGDGEPGAR